jgi:hypothetical protein
MPKHHSALVTTLLLPRALPLLMCACAGRGAPPAASIATVLKGSCKDPRAWQDDIGAIERGALASVEGQYIRNTCDGTAQVSGTQLHIRRPGPSQALDWMFRCGASRVVVGSEAPGTSATTVWLPDGLVDISVTARGPDVVVTLQGESVPKNIELLRRTIARIGGARP